jgi:hypothetical protein
MYSAAASRGTQMAPINLTVIDRSYEIKPPNEQIKALQREIQEIKEPSMPQFRK